MLHGDLLNRNVLVSHGGSRLAAVFDERLRCHELPIDLTHLAYCALAANREDDLRAVAQRTREILRPGRRCPPGGGPAAKPVVQVSTSRNVSAITRVSSSTVNSGSSSSARISAECQNSSCPARHSATEV